jgi:hypothetical protein
MADIQWLNDWPYINDNAFLYFPKGSNSFILQAMMLELSK